MSFFRNLSIKLVKGLETLGGILEKTFIPKLYGNDTDCILISSFDLDFQ